MTTNTSDLGWSFWGRWVIATVLAWVVGMLAAIVLSFAVVNPFYPKETNLIVGLCMGAAVGFAQIRASRRWLHLGWGWMWGTMLAMGVPFVMLVLFAEMGVDTSGGPGMWAAGGIVTVGGVTGGWWQALALRAYTARANLWILGALASWGAAWVVDGLVGFPGGGVAMGALGGAMLMWLLKDREAV